MVAVLLGKIRKTSPIEQQLDIESAVHFIKEITVEPYDFLLLTRQMAAQNVDLWPILWEKKWSTKCVRSHGDAVVPLKDLWGSIYGYNVTMSCSPDEPFQVDERRYLRLGDIHCGPENPYSAIVRCIMIGTVETISAAKDEEAKTNHSSPWNETKVLLYYNDE